MNELEIKTELLREARVQFLTAADTEYAWKVHEVKRQLFSLVLLCVRLGWEEQETLIENFRKTLDDRLNVIRLRAEREGVK